MKKKTDPEHLTIHHRIRPLCEARCGTLITADHITGTITSVCRVPDDVDARRLTDGDAVEVSTDIAEIQIPLEISNEVIADVISAPHGWSHDLNDIQTNVSDRRPDANTNAIIDEKLFDRPSIHSVLNGVLVQLSSCVEHSENNETHIMVN